jgi:hypothetical protein
MTREELVDLGKVLRAVAELQTIVNETHRQLMRLRWEVRRLPCMQSGSDPDTDPDCPALLSDAPIPMSHREQLRSVGEDEPDSVVTRPLSLHAGPFQFRGPSIFVVITAIAAFVLYLVFRQRFGI